MDNEAAKLLGTALFIGFLIGIMCGMATQEANSDSKWETRIVDDPDAIAAIRSAVLAERALKAKEGQ